MSVYGTVVIPALPPTEQLQNISIGTHHATTKESRTQSMAQPVGVLLLLTPHCGKLPNGRHRPMLPMLVGYQDTQMPPFAPSFHNS